MPIRHGSLCKRKRTPIHFSRCRSGGIAGKYGISDHIKSLHMESLKKNEDFKNCYQNGKSYVNRYLVLYMCGNGLGKNRYGISVSKKVGNSVVRHRTTRVIREVCRLHEGELGTDRDLVFVARVRAKELGYFRMERALLHLAEKAGILEKNGD